MYSKPLYEGDVYPCINEKHLDLKSKKYCDWSKWFVGNVSLSKD